MLEVVFITRETAMAYPVPKKKTRQSARFFKSESISSTPDSYREFVSIYNSYILSLGKDHSTSFYRRIQQIGCNTIKISHSTIKDMMYLPFNRKDK